MMMAPSKRVDDTPDSDHIATVMKWKKGMASQPFEVRLPGRLGELGESLPSFSLVIYYGISKSYRKDSGLTSYYHVAGLFSRATDLEYALSQAKAIELSYLTKAQLQTEFGYLRLSDLNIGTVFTVVAVFDHSLGKDDEASDILLCQVISSSPKWCQSSTICELIIPKRFEDLLKDDSLPIIGRYKGKAQTKGGIKIHDIEFFRIQE